MAALKASCDAYDGGQKWEAGRIAVSVHALVHDQGKRYKSILTQLGIRGSLRFLSSGRMTDALKTGFSPLVCIRIGSGTNGYFPHLDGHPASVPFGIENWTRKWVQYHEWWEDEYVSQGERYSVSRKSLVFALRNKEGFGHFGEIDDPTYAEMLASDTKINDAPVSPEFAIMRQVGWELLTTLEAWASGSNER